MAVMARDLRNKPLIVAALKMNVDGVNLEEVTLAYKILQTGLDNITSFVLGAEIMKVCLLYST